MTGNCNWKEFKRWAWPNLDTFLALLGGTVENKNFGVNSKGHTSLQR